MKHRAAAIVTPQIEPVDPGFMRKVFYIFLALGLAAGAISVAGKWLGRGISLAGHSDDTTIREVVIGNDVLAVASNTIRFERARHDGVASRLDLYMRWPGLAGYSEEARDAFNHASGAGEIIFASFEQRMMSRDMSGRFEPIYSRMTVKPGRAGPAGLTIYDFDAKSGYVNEVLLVAERPGKLPFVARCLSGPTAEESLAPCERDVQVGENLSLSYRFPAELLASWAELDAAMMAKTTAILKTPAK